MRVISFIMALLLGSQAIAQPITPPLTRVIYDDMGGYMRQYAEQGNKMNKDNTLVIFAGSCYSACTMFISEEMTFPKCMLRSATFGFHQPFMQGTATPEQQQFIEDLKKAMWEYYPNKVKDFLTFNGWPEGKEGSFAVMTAKDMEGVIPYC